ncbi:aromatic amino acid aminotransferase [Shewanella putrefaciens]|nr:aromatic amino acid aminotransferase [Shewanella putrefaciens]
MIFSQVVLAPADPILGLTDTFKADPRQDKVNLGLAFIKMKQDRPRISVC